MVETLFLEDITGKVLQLIGAITLLYFLFRALAKLFDSVDLLYNKIKVKLYYPIASRLSKREHKKYVETFFNKILFRNPIETPLSLGRIKVEWSNEESIDIDLEENIILIRVEYAKNVEKILARIAFLIAPYLVSKHLEPALGEKFSRLISIGIIENILQAYPIVLKECRKLVEETYSTREDYKDIITLISRADDTSLYKHILLYELQRILERFGARVDRDQLTNEIKELLRIIANLEEVDAPTLCGYYINLTIVRAGKLEKIVLKQWDRYVEYIKHVHRNCQRLQRIYIVSAGKYTTNTVKELLDYISRKIPGLRLKRYFRYRARYYKCMTNIPCLVAIMEIEHL